ncbi:MAG: hypothetical protein PHT07_14910 [Paludibacter sp.]|nr:hypothetical protein [Paludibacter sp.]
MVKYQYITMRQIDDELFENHPVYRIFNNKTGTQLGMISYYTPWKQYVFSAREGCVFNNKCLSDIIDFIKKEIK